MNRILLRGAAAVVAALVVVSAAAGAPAPDRSEAQASFTIQPLGPLTKSWPTIDFFGPYYYFLLTNTSAQPDSFRLIIANLTQPTWFPQVCLRAICFPDSTTIRMNAGASDTVGVNVVPLSDGVGEWDFVVKSVADPLLTSTFHLKLFAGTAAVGAPAMAASPGLQLAQSFPNPTRGASRIPFSLPRSGRVSLKVYDPAGRVVATLVDAVLPAGPHAATWGGEVAPGRRVPGGVYFYRLETPAGSLSKRMIVLR
jgi:hypothetical protein